MTESEYNQLMMIKETPKLLTVDDLQDKSNRTLLYGYDTDRRTWHTYLMDNEIVTVFYDSKPVRVSVSDNTHRVPNKRLYAECCDFEFCSLLRKLGVYLSFTTFGNNRSKTSNDIYYGKTL